jgi:hypothetical protein
MKRVYTTANGRRINLDAVIAQQEESIAVGNMKTNGRGDELGPGGRVERPKDKVMADYYKLNTPVATDTVPRSHKQTSTKDLVDDWVEPAQVEPEVPTVPVEPAKPALRGSLAGSVAKTQPVAPPEIKKSGPNRI